jgi:aryl-alcohol dehydrogenase-like predicted oxidoreductase
VPGDPNAGGAGAKAVYGSVHASLRRLQTDYVDLLWMHAWDYNTPIEETMRALDDLVRAGKVRYVGFSDTPAWKVAQAQVTAQFRGWAPLVGLQIEYNLLERTVEGELLPMARELGLGVTPWSPLKGGILAGKYTRANKDTVKPDRGFFVTRALNDRTYDLVDALAAFAKEQNTTPARIALAWVQSRPGVTSTIIGARTMDQLEQNLAALDVKLTDAQVQKLNALSEPQLGFPANFLKAAPSFMHAGLTVNGITAPASPIRRAEKT